MDPTGTEWVPDGNGGLCSTLDRSNISCYNPTYGDAAPGGQTACATLDPKGFWASLVAEAYQENR
jgi:hypothetical protein